MPAQIQEADSKQIDASSPTPAEGTERAIPKWAIVVGVLAFVIFNVLFLVFAMSLGSGNPG